MNLIMTAATPFIQGNLLDEKPDFRQNFLNMIQSYEGFPGQKNIVLLKGSEFSPIISNLENLGWKVKLVPLTLGSLPTAMLGLEGNSLRDQTVIVPGDSYIKDGYQDLIYAGDKFGTKAVIATLNASGPTWSYIRAGKDNRVLEIQEKREISNQAATGMFAFQSGQDFLDSAKWAFKNTFTTDNLYYVSSCIQAMLILGHRVVFAEVSDKKKYIYFGDRKGRTL
jgi:hypothetical protein